MIDEHILIKPYPKNVIPTYPTEKKELIISNSFSPSTELHDRTNAV